MIYRLLKDQSKYPYMWSTLGWALIGPLEVCSVNKNKNSNKSSIVLLIFSGQNHLTLQLIYMSVFLVRGYSLAGAIRSIYLFPVPTLLLHDRKEINVCFIFLWNISGSWICCKILYKMQCRKTYRRFWVQLFPSY